MTSMTATEFVHKIESLPPLPAIALNIQSIANAPNASAIDVGKALRCEPAIASRILRVANSSFYGGNQKVTQISRAVVMLGSRAIRNLVLGLCMRNTLAPSAENVGHHATLWRHSIAVAAVCDRIGRRLGFKPPEEAFLAGLLHDAGKLAMVGVDPNFISELFSKRLSETENLDAEREHFGLDHAEAGRQILAKWGLPESLCQVAGRHHASTIAIDDDADRLVAITIVANDMVRIMGYGPDAPVAGDRQPWEAVASLGLTKDDVGRLFAGLAERIDETVDLLELSDVRKEDEHAVHTPSLALWISDEPSADAGLCRAFLRGSGCDIRRIAPHDLPEDLSSEDVYFIDVTTAATFHQVASSLAAIGCGKIAVLADSRDGLPCRQREPTCGAYVIPRVFTVFDLQWMEQQWQK